MTKVPVPFVILFINRLQVYETVIRNSDLDPAALYSGIEEFGFRHMISRRLINRMLTVAEELCIQTLLPLMGNDDEIHLVFEYNDTNGGSVTMEITCPGTDRNPLDHEDDLSLALTRHACSTLSCHRDSGIWRIDGKLES